MKAGDVLLIGVVGVGAYLLYKLIEPAAAASANIAQAANADTSAAASAIVWATTPLVQGDTGNVVLYPGGEIVPITAIAGGISYDDSGVGTFSWTDVDYQICQNPTGGPAYDVNGNYPAYPQSTGCPS